MRRKKTIDTLQLLREVELLKEQVKELQMTVNGTAVDNSTKNKGTGENVAAVGAGMDLDTDKLKESEQIRDTESVKV